jgi:hypothetical protein
VPKGLENQGLATIGAAAGGTHFGAARCADGFVDRQDDFRDPRFSRPSRQAITAAWAAYALHQAGAAQAGKKLLQIGQRDFLPCGDV